MLDAGRAGRALAGPHDQPHAAPRPGPALLAANGGRGQPRCGDAASTPAAIEAIDRGNTAIAAHYTATRTERHWHCRPNTRARRASRHER